MKDDPCKKKPRTALERAMLMADCAEKKAKRLLREKGQIRRRQR